MVSIEELKKQLFEERKKLQAEKDEMQKLKLRKQILEARNIKLLRFRDKVQGFAESAQRVKNRFRKKGFLPIPLRKTRFIPERRFQQRSKIPQRQLDRKSVV